eukprot:COSAG06_NODE_624_length_13686_cov_86.804666_17_plen_98_part_00
MMRFLAGSAEAALVPPHASETVTSAGLATLPVSACNVDGEQTGGGASGGDCRCGKRSFVSAKFYTKMIILPTQAWDKRKEPLKKEMMRFPQGGLGRR